MPRGVEKARRLSEKGKIKKEEILGDMRLRVTGLREDEGGETRFEEVYGTHRKRHTFVETRNVRESRRRMGSKQEE